MISPTRLAGRAYQAIRPARMNPAPVASWSHWRVPTDLSSCRRWSSLDRSHPTEGGAARKPRLRGGERGGRHGGLAIRVDREVLLEVGELEEAAHRPLRRDDEQLLPRAVELIGAADDDAERGRVDERGAAHVEDDDRLRARGAHREDGRQLGG